MEMKVNKYLLLFIAAVLASSALVGPIDAACTSNKITVNTNLQGAPVTVTAPDIYSAGAKKTLSDGETWDIGSGYTLTLQSTNVFASPRTATFVFSLGGSVLDNRTVPQGQTYSYSNIFNAYVDSIFAGATTNMVQLRYIYFFSQPYFWTTKSGITSTQSGAWWYWESDYIYFENESWTVSYGNMDGYLTPANETKNAVATNCIEFSGVYVPTTGSISVSSSPSSASIYLDGVYWGTTTSTMVVAAGSHTITLKRSGYQDWSLDINVVAGQTYSFSPQLTPVTPVPTSPAPSSGSIIVSSSPSGASVYLDGVYWGTTTSTMVVAAGSHTITLKRSGYQDWSQDINVVAGQTYSFSPPLTPVTPVPTSTPAPVTIVPTPTPAPSQSSPYIYGIGIIAIVLIVIAALKRRFSYQETKPAKTKRKVRPEPVPETIPPSIPKEEQKLYKCPNCGAEILEGDRFCGECGKPLRS